MMKTLNCREVKFSGHALRRMFERKLQKDDIVNMTKSGEIIAKYPDDKPYPSYLILGFIKNAATHIVVAIDSKNQLCYIITAYMPTGDKWESDFRRRKKL